MKTKLFMIGAGLIVAAALPVYAHHAFASEFDSNKPVTLTGAVTKLEWMNPHIWLYLDVKDAGSVQQWQCEGGAPNTLTRNGWSRDSLKSGDELRASFIGSGLLDLTTGEVTFIGVETYDGGTGRFVQATGSSNLQGDASIVTNRGFFTVNGRIAY